MKFYEIKKNGKWEMVTASGMSALNNYCNVNGYTDWRVVGMMSRAEIASAKSTCRAVA